MIESAQFFEGDAIYCKYDIMCGPDWKILNGTRVNGVLLHYQEKVLLSPGMEIAFAGEKYIFYEKESNPLT